MVATAEVLAEDGLSAQRATPASGGGGGGGNVSRGTLRGDAAGYIRRPRRARGPGATKLHNPLNLAKDPLGNRGVGDLTTNMTHATRPPLPGWRPPGILQDPSSFAFAWAEGLEVALDGLHG